MAKITDAKTAPEPEVTAPAGEPTPPAEGAEQKNDADAVGLQAKVAELQAIADKLAKERDAATAEKIRQEAMYKGLQNQTTKTLQKAAEDRKALEQERVARAELQEIKQLLGAVTSKVLDESEQKELEYQQREARIKAEQAWLEAQKANPVQPEPTIAPQYTDPDAEKARFLDFYFHGIDIDPKDPGIDWGEGETDTRIAFSRFTTSVLKLKAQKDQEKTQDVVATLQKQAAETLAEIKAQQAELKAKADAEVEQAKAEAEEAARKKAEAKLRKMGVDVAGTPPPESDTKRTLGQKIDNDLDESLLTKGKPFSKERAEGQAEYARRLAAIQNEIRGR